VIDTLKQRRDIQLKGSGRTPFSRGGDGKAALGPVLREYLIGESMHALGVPTTRALAAVTTGDDVYREIPLPGAVLTRVAASHIRIGTFEFGAARGDVDKVRKLADYAIARHYPEIVNSENQYLAFFEAVSDAQAALVARWMNIGFIHGVMNTDNMSIHGLTIDYGPYGWLEDYNPGWTPNTTDASTRRYRYGQQPQIGAWNVARFLEAMVPLMDEPEHLHQVLDAYTEAFEEHNNSMWVTKLGLDEFTASDEPLIRDLNALLQEVETDMTIFFRLLCSIETPHIDSLTDAFYNSSTIPTDEWNAWLQRWWLRTDGSPNRSAMRKANPKYVLRNWMAQLAINAAEAGDFSVAEQLYILLQNPYDEQPESEEEWFQKRPEWARHQVGCSMLSCSS
jgi:uncharacterized protein YdiU (UPF0061 family)